MNNNTTSYKLTVEDVLKVANTRGKTFTSEHLEVLAKEVELLRDKSNEFKTEGVRIGLEAASEMADNYGANETAEAIRNLNPTDIVKG